MCRRKDISVIFTLLCHITYMLHNSASTFVHLGKGAFSCKRAIYWCTKLSYFPVRASKRIFTCISATKGIPLTLKRENILFLRFIILYLLPISTRINLIRTHADGYKKWAFITLIILINLHFFVNQYILHRPRAIPINFLFSLEVEKGVEF